KTGKEHRSAGTFMPYPRSASSSKGPFHIQGWKPCHTFLGEKSAEIDFVEPRAECHFGDSHISIQLNVEAM
ncbi:hypothetical protein P7K49_014312, partial [Saguinus oedipus]